MLKMFSEWQWCPLLQHMTPWTWMFSVLKLGVDFKVHGWSPQKRALAYRCDLMVSVGSSMVCSSSFTSKEKRANMTSNDPCFISRIWSSWSISAKPEISKITVFVSHEHSAMIEMAVNSLESCWAWPAWVVSQVHGSAVQHVQNVEPWMWLWSQQPDVFTRNSSLRCCTENWNKFHFCPWLLLGVESGGQLAEYNQVSLQEQAK